MNEARMYVPSVECTSVVHVVMLSLNSAGEGADSKFAAQLRSRSADRIRLALASRSTAGTLRLTSLSTILIDAMEKSN